ncbi:MAG: hypothetical protein QOD06_2112 [Candidatus Binatota bacterium]|nr:hypothetical protein [Candidatus Binatota bacterium]
MARNRRSVVLVACLAGMAAAFSPSQAPGFSAPVVVTPPDVDFLTEPGVDVSMDGRIYVNAPGGLPLSSYLFRSDDGGATFHLTDLSLRDLMPGGGDSDVALDPKDGTLYFSDLYLGNSTMAVSHTRGDTLLFVANPAGGVPVHDRPWVATPGNGVAYFVYAQVPTGLWVSKSVDGGLTYPLATMAASLVDCSYCGAPGNLIAEGGDPLATTGNVGVIYATGSGGVGFARSTDGGLDWTQAVVSKDQNDLVTTAAFAVVANAGGGKLVATWLELLLDGNGKANRSRVRFSRSANWGATWDAPVTLVADGTSVFPWIDARGSKVAVVLYHTSAVGSPDTVPAASQWFVEYLESTTGGVPSTPTIVDTVPVKTGPVCTEGTGCAGDRELGDFFQVTIDPANRSNVAWARVKSGGATEMRFSRQ